MKLKLFDHFQSFWKGYEIQINSVQPIGSLSKQEKISEIEFDVHILWIFYNNHTICNIEIIKVKWWKLHLGHILFQPIKVLHWQLCPINHDICSYSISRG